MSVNTGINAAIALIENRHKDFKNILSEDPDFKNISVSITAVRLYMALDNYFTDRLRNILKECLTITPTSEEIENIDSFYQGVRAVEQIFESKLEG